jgi:glycosyltransferase involved in cell wall biosynthesis
MTSTLTDPVLPPPATNSLLRVLHVAQPVVGGSLRVAGDLATDQIRRGWTVDIACRPDSELDAIARGLGITPLAWRASRAPGADIVRETRDLGRIIAQADPDVVHLHSAKAGLAGRLTLRGSRATVYQPHAWSFEAARGLTRRAAVAWERWATRWADLVICVSEDERRSGRERGITGPYVVVPNGVDLGRYTAASDEDRAAARRELGLEAGPVAVTIGRVCEQKAQDALLAAWPRVLAAVPDAQLVIVGDGEDRTSLRALGTPRVLFPGARDDVDRWLAACDVCVITSRWEAGLTLTAMEAMARGRSVVTTDVAGMRWGLGQAGAIVPIDAAEPLVRALVERLRDPALAAHEGAAGRRRVEAAFQLSHTTQRIADLYTQAVALRGRRRPDDPNGS